MKLVGELKKQVEETNNKEEAKEIIEKAGMELTDEELDCVTGGIEIETTLIKRNNNRATDPLLDVIAHKNAEISVDAGDGFDVMTLFCPGVKNKFNKFGN